MKVLRNWKSALFAAAIFLAGVLTGGINTLGLSKHMQQERMSIENLQSSLQELLEEELQLSPAQAESIRPILVEACEAYRQESLRAMNRVNEVVAHYNQQIARELNPDQVEQLRELEQSRRESQKDLKSQFFND